MQKSIFRIERREVNFRGETRDVVRDEFRAISDIFKFEIVDFLVIFNFLEDRLNFTAHNVQDNHFYNCLILF